MNFYRITAVYLDNGVEIKEDRLVILTAIENHRIVDVRWFGEWKSEYNIYPFILDKTASEFNFGSNDTEIWRTNLGKKEIQQGAFFTIWIDDEEYTYCIERIHEYQ